MYNIDIMKKNTQEKTKRNESLYIDYISGTSYRDLMQKYDLGVSRVYAIIRAQRKKIINKEKERHERQEESN